MCFCKVTYILKNVENETYPFSILFFDRKKLKEVDFDFLNVFKGGGLC